MDDPNYKIAYTQSELIKNFPVTLALLVKILHKDHEKIDLQFEVLEYGFSQYGTIFTQPRLVLKNDQTGEITISNSSNMHMNLKVTGKWA